jgi:hypothetical protein
MKAALRNNTIPMILNTTLVFVFVCIKNIFITRYF